MSKKARCTTIRGNVSQPVLIIEFSLTSRVCRCSRWTKRDHVSGIRRAAVIAADAVQDGVSWTVAFVAVTPNVENARRARTALTTASSLAGSVLDVGRVSTRRIPAPRKRTPSAILVTGRPRTILITRENAKGGQICSWLRKMRWKLEKRASW